MRLTDVLDCLIPRGGPSLIAAMREHARVPYVLDGDGNCHVFVDASADLDEAARDREERQDLAAGRLQRRRDGARARSRGRGVPAGARARHARGRVARRAARARCSCPTRRSATEEDFAREFLDLILAVKVVDSLDEAIAHVAQLRHGSQRSDPDEDAENAEAWVRRVDAAAVLVNASTRFIDGGELGLGGEVGISTQKLHARGPMGLRELTCLKWVVRGEGQIR